MKKLLLVLLELYSLTSFAQVETYTFSSSDPGNQASKAVTSKDANITSSDITRGAGITPASATSSINASGWISTTQDANDYYEFTLTPNSGYQLNLTGLSLTERRSNSGPTNYLIAYSIGGGAEVPVSTGTLSGTVDAAISTSFSVHTAQPIRFRIYAWGASSAAGTLRLDQSLTVNGAAPLPVKLISFTGQSSNKSVILNWATSWEEKNEGFEILRSTTATSFEKIGFVKGQATTQGLSVYSFTDTNVDESSQLYYYQLRQRDTGGGSELSNIIAVRVQPGSDERTAFVYPNPNQGSFILSANDLAASIITLYNPSGIEVPLTIDRNQGRAKLSIVAGEPIPTGMYLLTLLSSDGVYKQSFKVIVQ
ncbi:T9SS type A sorting domain-containing protein [Spirosoma sp. HMF3257]|uniref:T9SS type A sorting domain-containing protein n=1 Tax=Spirosoma telluris TaxID=2183553 RepID=A0A327NVQ3_9BACT|nr:T9SS type A sorting domain-containing protein [Spirosoma telluris]RAI76918.1 hypothetical protein HMF3257_27020 [Spirosoma telluris]